MSVFPVKAFIVIQEMQLQEAVNHNIGERCYVNSQDYICDDRCHFIGSFVKVQQTLVCEIVIIFFVN